MLLSPGARLGPYEIVAAIGAGGMGEVYRARDARLQRDVAIKVLPEGVALDPDRLARFQREAQLVAALNHPHIAHVYGLEEDPSLGTRTCALVMELVEGPTLAERLTSLGLPSAIPIDEALTIARQIADALEAAHERGIVHRDLKPANIKLTADGSVKVLDFGLAKALEPLTPDRAWELSPAAFANSPTITTPGATARGVIIGTAAYMSPEQARGKLVDKRADIWAFGVVLYEMLTGRRLFTGETVSDILAEVLKSDPDLGTLPPATPPRVRRLLARCLQRDPRQRLRDIGDARFDLDERDEPLPGVETPRRRLRILPFLAAGIAIALLGGAAAWSWLRPSTTIDAAPVRFLITPSDGVALDDPPMFALSPDGRHILIRGSEAGVPYWYVREIASRQVRRLNTTRGAGAVGSWSSDGAWIGFYKTGSFYRVAIDDTRLQALGPGGASAVQGSSSWSATGDLVFIEGPRVLSIAEGGGTPRVVLELDPKTKGWGGPWMLPDGRHFLLQNADTPAGNILLASLDGGEAPRVLERGTQAAYAAPGWLLAIRNRQLLAWKFDSDRATLANDPVVVIGDLGLRAHLGGRSFSVSQTGVLAIRNDVTAPTRIVWFDRTGVEGTALKLEGHCRNPEIAPDGTRAAVECYDETNSRDIWLYDFARDAASRFTVDPADDANALWSPDGRSIMFDSNRRGSVDVFRKGSGGTSQEELVLETPENTHAMSWSRDGRYLSVTVSGFGLAILDLRGDRKLLSAVDGSFQELELQFSPDGKFFSYSSDESGRSEIYVQPWPPTGDRWQISTDGATDARWRPDGKEVFFISPDRRLMAAAIDTSRGFHAGTPTRLFQTRIAGPLGSGHRFPYALSPDGKRFLMYVSEARPVPPSIDVIVNWPALLPNK
jgi:serine/threonine protein kinase/Tol biopolymer transport system component